MKFDKLFKIITEDRKGSKKNRGGRILHGAKESEGPIELPGSSAGFSDNPQLRVPSSKWEYDPMQGGKGKSGFQQESQLWRSMMNSIGLLLNDEHFGNKVKRIGDTFTKSLDSFKNIKGYDEDGAPVKYDEESKLESLDRMSKRLAGELTGLRQEIDDETAIIAKNNWPQDKKDKLFVRVGELEGKYKRLTKINKKRPSKELDAKIAEVDSELKRLSDIHGQATMKPHQVSVYEKSLEEKLAEYEEKEQHYQDTLDELAELNDRISNINTTNETADDRATTAFINYVKYTAQDLADQHRDKVQEAVSGVPLDQIDWGDLTPQKTIDNIAKLDALASDDPEVNPLLGYLERFKRDYEDRDFNISHALDRNTNITKIRDRNRLPFMTLLRLYNSVNLRKPLPIESKADTVEHKTAVKDIQEYLKAKSQNTPETILSWKEPETKGYLTDAINNLALPPAAKKTLIGMLDRPWNVIPRNKMNSFTQLLSTIESDLKRYKPQKESFDNIASKILQEKRYDDDDFKIDTIEVLNSIKRSK